MEIKYNYTCSDEEAYKKIDSFLDNLVKQHGDLVSNTNKKWNSSKNKMNFSFEAKGFDINGDMIIDNGKLTLNGKLPWLAKPFSGKIESIIYENLNNLFNKKGSGDYFG